MTYATILTLLISVLFLTFVWIRKRYSFFKENGYLYKKPSFPFGNLNGLGKQFHLVELLQNVYKDFKGKSPACGIYFFITPNVMLIDLDVIKDVLIKNFNSFRNRGLFYNEKDDPLTAHIFAIEDQAWRNMRLKLTPTFTSGKMKMMFGTLLDVSNHMIQQLKTEQNLEMFEVKEMVSKFTTDVIGNVAFGLEMNAIENPDSEFRQMGKKFFGGGNNFLLKALFLATFRDLARKLRMTFLPRDVTKFFMGKIRETIDYRIENKIERNDFINLLLKMYVNENGKDEEKLTFNQLAAQCLVFFNAGFETSSSTITFVLYNLALHQDIQEKIRDDIKTVIAKYDNKITFEGMNEIKYLQMIIDETLRLYGPVSQIIRQASEDYKIPKTDLVIPKGTLAMIPTYSIHRDPEFYPEPEKFDPERFSEENKSKRHPMAFLPFGDGPRNCIGMRFGLMQTKIGLIQLLLNFKFSPTSKTFIPIQYDKKIPFLTPPGGMWLKIETLSK